MRVCCWNVRRASSKSEVWKYLAEVSPDLALLQEVTAIPPSMAEAYDVVMHRAAWKKLATSLRISTAILVRGTIGPRIALSSLGMGQSGTRSLQR